MNSIDTQIKYWDKVSTEKTFTHPINIEKLKQYISLDSSILDIGCGYGRICNELYNLGYLNIIGIDSSRKMIERGQKEYSHIQLEHLQGDALPFDSNKFDTIILFAVLTCIPTNDGQIVLVRELFRVLKPNGILYVSDYWLQNNERNLNRYNEFTTKYDQYGVFELPEGAIVRHHTRDWINSLFANFHTLDSLDCEFESMNGNKSTCFQLFVRKPEVF